MYSKHVVNMVKSWDGQKGFEIQYYKDVNIKGFPATACITMKIMELFSYANIQKASRPLDLCQPGKRAPNWTLTTKGNLGNRS
jgi:hypothetical protein